ncbi:MAG: hypothetical protein WBX15_02360 [Thermoanaerobaculia bacterium]
MSLDIPNAPVSALHAVRSAATKRNLSLPRTLRAESEAQLDLVFPHEVFELSAQAVLGTDPLTEARSLGWRFLIAAEKEIVGAALAARMEPGFQFSHLAPDPAQFVEVLSSSAVQTGPSKTYVPRLLHIRAAGLSAIWYHADDHDLLIGLPPLPKGMEERRLYLPNSFFDLIRPGTRVRMNFERARNT